MVILRSVFWYVVLACFVTIAPLASAAGLEVGFAQIGDESAWRLAETQSIKNAAKERGHTLLFANARQSQAEQIKALRSFITKGVDAIILAPIVADGWEAVLKEIAQAKSKKGKSIPVILVDRGIKADKSLYTTLISSDFVAEGRIAGEWAAKELGGKGNIIEIEGGAGADPTINRKKGFNEIVSRNPGMKVVHAETASWQSLDAMVLVEKLLKEAEKNQQKIDLIYAHNDDMAIGAAKAIEKVGKKPGTEIKLVSVDGTKAAFQAMVDGKLNATVDCNPLLGPLAFDALEKALEGKPLPKWIVQDDKINLAKDAAAMLNDRKY